MYIYIISKLKSRYLNIKYIISLNKLFKVNYNQILNMPKSIQYIYLNVVKLNLLINSSDIETKSFLNCI